MRRALSRALGRRLGVTLAMLLTTATLTAQAPSLDRLMEDMRKACQGRATCSEADLYSGTLEWSETFSATIGSGGDRSQTSSTFTITMVVTSGQVQCTGTLNETTQRWIAGRLVEDRQGRGAIAGSGLFRIEFGEGGSHSAGSTEVELDPDAPSYNVSVACPSAAMTVTGGGQSETTPAEPASWESSLQIQSYDWPGDFSQPRLQGGTSYDHPDADPANGISGTVTFKWSLTKGTLPAQKP